MFKGRTIQWNQNNNSKSLFKLRKKNSNFEIIKVAKSEVQFKEEFNYQFALYQRVPGKQVKYQFIFSLLRFGKTTHASAASTSYFTCVLLFCSED